MPKTFSKGELTKWIDFVYSDLLTHQIYIGGFYFTLDQLDDFEKKQSKINSNLVSINSVHDTTYPKDNLNVIQDVSGTSDLIKSVSCSTNFASTKIIVYNKLNEKVELPITNDELDYICKRLRDVKNEVEQFKIFLDEEVKNVEPGDEATFFIFIQDYLEDVKKVFTEETLKVQVKIPLIK